MNEEDFREELIRGLFLIFCSICVIGGILLTNGILKILGVFK